MAFGRARQALPARRVLSTLGNPMFPQRPLPELETFEESIENSKKAKQANGGDPEKKGFVDILADHGGKIALVVFGGVIALFYTYYASGKDRNKLEDGISEAALIEPYEIQELRFTNKLSKDDFVAIADQCRTHFHSGQATYAEFVLFLRDKVVLPALPVDTSSSTSHYNSFDAYGGNNKTTGAPQAAAAPRRVQLNSAHLLDRVIMGHIQRKFAPSTPASTAEASALSSSSGSDFVHAAQSGVTESHINGVPTKTVSWTSTPLDVDLLLVILNLAMVPQAEARVQALYELAKLYPESTSGEHAHSAAVSSSGSSGDSADSNAKDASGDTLSQDTVPRGELSFCFVLFWKWCSHSCFVSSFLFCSKLGESDPPFD